MESPRRTIRVVVVDDHEGFRASLIALLANYDEYEVVAGFASAEALIAYLAQHRAETSYEAADGVATNDAVDAIDLVLLDVHLPAMSGIEAVPVVRRLAPDAAIVLCSTDTADSFPGVLDAIRPAIFVEKALLDTDSLLDVVEEQRAFFRSPFNG